MNFSKFLEIKLMKNLFEERMPLPLNYFIDLNYVQGVFPEFQ